MPDTTIGRFQPCEKNMPKAFCLTKMTKEYMT